MDLVVKKQYKTEDYQHENDRIVIEKIIKSPVIDTLIRFLEENKIERVYQTVYETSCLEITAKMSPEIAQMVQSACRMFGLDEQPKVYLTRDYNEGISVGGASKPFILISSNYIKRAGKEILAAGIASAVAAICAGHHRVAFLLWAVDEIADAIPGKVKTVLMGALNEWSHVRIYTVDRAFYLAARDYGLSLEQIFVQLLPEEYRKNFRFGSKEDAYLEQKKDFMNANGFGSMIQMMKSLSTEEAWIPLRCEELKKFHKKEAGLWNSIQKN